MNRRNTVLALLALGAATGPIGSIAQQRSKIWRIGMLDTTSMAMNAVNLDAFRRGLRELGYVEEQNLSIEYRSIDGHPERIVGLINEVVGMKVDVIVTRGTPATLAARNATRTIPVVSTAIADPVRSGLVKSLSRPGGNVTGLESFANDLVRKRLQLLKDTFEGVKRVGYLQDMSNPAAPPAWKETETAARALVTEVQLLDVRKPEDLEGAFDGAIRQRIGALVVQMDALNLANRKTIVELAAKHQLPTMYAGREFVDAGGLMSYGVSYPQLYYRAASYVDKIFKGAKAADLPVEQPTKFELVINLKTAKTLGLTIPPSILVRADEVIQ